MNSFTNLNTLIESFQEKGIVSEEDVRSKFILPLLEWLGYPDEVRAEDFPVYRFEGSNRVATKKADYILFSERGYESHINSEQADVDWVRDHSLLVVEAKRPGQMSKADFQPEFYRTWTRTPAYILTDSIQVKGRFWNEFTSDYNLLDCNVRDLVGEKALQCFSYDRLLSFKRKNLDAKEHVEMVAGDMALLSDVKEYAAVDHYIPRRVRRIADNVISDDVGIAVDEECFRLWDACRIDRHVILIGEAGTGKSKELQQLAHIVSTQDNPLIPIVFPMKDYNGESMEDIVKETTGLTYCANSILILDAFDEIPEHHAQAFLHSLNRYVERYPKQYIVISTRFNFYRCSEGVGYEGPLKQFKEYTLHPFSKEDIESFLQMKGINCSSFLEEVDRKHLSGIISIPFYLYHIAHLYLDNDGLPTAEALMEKLVRNSFRNDDHKYAIAFNDDLGRANAYNVLKKIAFIMQCLMTNALSEKDYGRILTTEERRIIKYCSVWTQDAQRNYHFEHNNFREFLAAQALLELSAERQVSLVTDGERIKPSWFNTTSYLLQSDPEGVIFRWIREHNLFDAIHMEPDKLSAQLREDIFTELWRKCKEESVIIVPNSPGAKGLARFGQTKKCIHHLCDDLSRVSDERCRRNAFRILQCMDDYCGFRNVIRKLLKMIVMSNVDEATSAEALHTLGEESLYDTEDLEWMLNIDYVHTSLVLRRCVYDYVCKHQLQSHCTDYILEGLDILKSRRHFYDHGLVVMSEILIKRFRSYEMLHAFFDWFVRNKENLLDIRMAHFSECMEVLLKNASALYKEGCIGIADDLIAVHLSGIMYVPLKISDCTRNILAETGLIFNAYETILREYSEYPLYIYMLRETMDRKCLQDLLHRYGTSENAQERRQEGENENAQITDAVLLKLMYAYGVHTVEYKQISCAIANKTGNAPPLPELSWDKKNNLDRQLYFDTLFDKESFYRILAGFLQKYHGEKTTFKDINTHNEDIVNLSSVQGYLSMWYMLKQYGDKREHILISGFFEDIQWETFAVSQMYYSLKADRNLVLQEEQLAYIHAYTDKTLSCIDFEKETICNKDGSIRYSWRLLWACFFAARFDFEYDTSLYRKLLLVPGQFFDPSREDIGALPSYILSHLEPEDLYQTVVDLCNSGKAIGENAIRFIRYAKEQGWPDLESLADTIIKDDEYRNWGKSDCLLYLLMFNTPGEILHSYMEKADDELRTILLSMCVTDELEESDRMWLRNILEKIWLESGKKKEYLRYLISLNSECGLEEYCRLVEEQNGIPDYAEDGTVSVLTETIEEITDVNLLDRILHLAELAHGENFKDNKDFGLKSSIGRVLLTLGEKYPNQVISKLRFLQRKCNAEESLAYYCRFYIDSVWSTTQ